MEVGARAGADLLKIGQNIYTFPVLIVLFLYILSKKNGSYISLKIGIVVYVNKRKGVTTKKGTAPSPCVHIYCPFDATCLKNTDLDKN